MPENYSKYSDDKLFQELKKNNRAAEKSFGELYSRYSQRIYAYCLRISGSPEDASDIFQEVFLNFYKSSKSLKKLDNIPGYLMRIARNLCINHSRSKRVTLNIEDFNCSTNDKGYEQKELLGLIASALECLDFEYRETFILRQYHGLAYKEIADITGEPISTIRNRVWRAKEKIKNILQPYLKDLSS